jgi:YVTN family beta-propeller protein
MCAACGSTSAVKPKPTVTPTPVNSSTLPPAGTVSATFPSIGGSIDSGYIYGLAADDTAVWVHNPSQGTVLRVDPKTNQVVATIKVGQGLGDVVLEAGFVWVGNHDDSTISKIDPRTNKVVDTIPLPPPTGFLTVSPGAIWVASKANDEVMKIDPSTDQVITSIMVPGGPTWMAFAAGSVWVCIHDGSAYGVTRVDATTNKVLANIDIGSANGYYCQGIAASNGEVWAGLLDSSQNYDEGLVRIDPTTNKVVTTIFLPQSAVSCAFTGDAQGVWIAEAEGLFHISSTTNQATGYLHMPVASGVTVGAGSVWVVTGDGTLSRIAPAS